jgi:hypothetical protein
VEAVVRWATVVVSYLLCASAIATAQVVAASDDSKLQRGATLSGGIGNAYGWCGVTVQTYFAGGRAAVFGGVGYTPDFQRGDPSGMTVAGGLRAFSDGRKHRMYGELSFAQIGIEVPNWLHVNGRRIYGPGAQLGYEYTTSRGLHLSASIGAGYGLGISDYETPWRPMLGLGIGYTWLR